MSLTTTEVRLKLNDGIAPSARQPINRHHKQIFEASGEIGAAKELSWLLVFVASFALIHLPQIRSELGLLVPSTRDVSMWGHHFTPRFESTLRFTLGRLE